MYRKGNLQRVFFKWFLEMASFKDCIDFPYYAIYLSFKTIEFSDYQITAMDYKNHTRKSLNL